MSREKKPRPRGHLVLSRPVDYFDPTHLILVHQPSGEPPWAWCPSQTRGRSAHTKIYDEVAVVPPPRRCTEESPCCDRRDEYNGYASGPTIFRCPKGCSCHD